MYSVLHIDMCEQTPDPDSDSIMVEKTIVTFAKLDVPGLQLRHCNTSLKSLFSWLD